MGNGLLQEEIYALGHVQLFSVNLLDIFRGYPGRRFMRW